jgi:hypothetical protein
LHPIPSKFLFFLTVRGISWITEMKYLELLPTVAKAEDPNNTEHESWKKTSL